MNYEETLQKIHGFETFGSRLGLERMRILMERLGNPQDTLPIIHVAGTNGKGSVCRYVSEVLKEHGYRVGLYTSPYLERFTERIEFDGSEIAEQDLIDCAEVVFAAVDWMLARGEESPTEFELVTAIGFVYFQRVSLDFLVLEVGLGGTGDSTNLIKAPLVSVVTSISYDHMEVLGDTLELIAAEKAGIIKNGHPVVSNVKDAPAAAVIRKIAFDRNCDFIDASETQPSDVVKSLDGYGFTIGKEDPYRLCMVGMHQVENAICALKVIEALEKRGIIKIDPDRVRKAMASARQKGRFEILKKNPYLIIDGAHNEAGAEALVEAMETHFPGQRLLLVLGMLADKKVDALLKTYGRLKGDIITAEPDNPRKLGATVLCERIRETGRECQPAGDWKMACDHVDRRMADYDVILFAGSLYLIGRVRERYSWHKRKS